MIPLLLIMLYFSDCLSYRLSTKSIIPAKIHRNFVASNANKSLLKLMDTNNLSIYNNTSDVKTQKNIDHKAIASYIGATSLQWGLMILFLHLLQSLINKINTIKELKSYQSVLTKVLVNVTFLFLSLRSRVFSPLSNPRPKAQNDPIFEERLRPSWQPPQIAFPIIWSIISILRMISSSLVYSTAKTLLCPGIFSFLLHLSIGDTWNTINNVEKRLGTSFLGSLFVWLSIATAVWQYYKVNPLAGYILSPSLLWLTIASYLIYSIWRLNYERFNRPSLLPTKRDGFNSKWKLPFTSFNS